MENIGETIIALIGSEVCGGTLSLRMDSPLTDGDFAQMYSLAKNHDIAHILGSALANNGLLAGSSMDNIYREQIYYTAFRYENLKFAFEKVCGVLEKAKIPYIPLKGAVIRDLYPQPWMRTGCDIDILVHEEYAENAANIITESLGYQNAGRGKHDIQILSTEKIYVELHFSLLEEDASPAMAKVLAKAWEHAKPAEEGKYRYELDDAMFYFYHIAHMAKHFIGGGCGIRPFLDLWLLGNSENYDTPETAALLKKAKLTDFAREARKLSEVWFSGAEHDEVTKIMEEFIISGGCFGSKETKMLSDQQKAGGRLRHIISRIFVPYDDLKGQYPIIKKYRFLTPLCEICRLFTLLFGRRKNFRKNYIENLMGVPEKHLEDIDYLFKKTRLF